MLVKIELHDGSKLEAVIENFVLSEFIEKVNKDMNKMIEFGKYGVIGHSIKFVDANNEVTTTE